MPRTVKTRAYHSPLRAEQAAATRRAVLDAARGLFAEQGYAGTTVAAVARRARVAPDTVYAAVGRKPQLLLALVDEVLAGTPQPTAAEDRDYVRAIRAAPGARAKLTTYALALGRLQPQVAPLVEALRAAAATDEASAQAWRALRERRAANMLLLAADLRGTGELRADLTDAEVADLLWSTNASEYYLLLAERGWSPERYAALLADLWARLLLA